MVIWFAQRRKGAKASCSAAGAIDHLTISSNASDWMESGFAAKPSSSRLCAFARTLSLLRVSAPPRELFHESTTA